MPIVLCDAGREAVQSACTWTGRAPASSLTAPWCGFSATTRVRRRPPETWSLQARVAAGTSFGDSSAGGSFEIGVEPGLLGVRGYSRPAESAKVDPHPLVSSSACRCGGWSGVSVLTLFLPESERAGGLADFGVSTDSLLPVCTTGRNLVWAWSGRAQGLDVIAAHLLPVSVTPGPGRREPIWSWRGTWCSPVACWMVC